MANPGKNKVVRYQRLWVAGFDLSGDSRSYSQLLNEFGEVDLTGWNDGFYKVLSNQRRQVGLEGYKAFLNDAASGAHTALANPSGAAAVPLTFSFGGLAEPDYGDIAYLMQSVQLEDTAAFEEEAAVLQANFKPLQAGIDGGNPFGIVLYPKTAISSTNDGTSTDNGEATSNGFVANLHVFITASGDFTFEVEHSENDSIWTTLGTFTIDGGTVESETIDGSGTVNQYLRLAITRVTGSATIAASIARK